MPKLAPAHHTTPSYQDCEPCAGTGVFTGMFHSGSCDHCLGCGWVSKDGTPMPTADIISIQRAMINVLEGQIERLNHIPGVRQAIDAYNERRLMNSIYPEGRPPLD